MNISSYSGIAKAFVLILSAPALLIGCEKNENNTQAHQPQNSVVDEYQTEAQKLKLLLAVKHDIDTGVDCRDAKTLLDNTTYDNEKHTQVLQDYRQCFEQALYYHVHRLPFLEGKIDLKHHAANAEMFWEQLAKLNTDRSEN